jgi:hypothetical protein
MYKNGITDAWIVKMTPRDGKFLIPVRKFQWAFYSFSIQIYGTEPTCKQ